MNRRQIKQALADAAFDPNEGLMKIISQTGTHKYFIMRVIEYCKEMLDSSFDSPCDMPMAIDHELNMAMGLLALTKVSLNESKNNEEQERPRICNPTTNNPIT